MSKTRKATLLDVDSSIIENNLLLDSNREHEKEMDRLFPNLEMSEPPSKLVKPSAGCCIKTKKVDGSKVFVNVCHTEFIPPPANITESQLAEMLASDTEEPEFRVPMSIGNPRQEADKSGALADVYDVAVNQDFFRRIEMSEPFRSFLFQVVLEAVQQKYSIELKDDEFVVLKNRKSIGALQQHRVQVRESKPVHRPLIEEVRVQPEKRELVAMRAPAYRLIQLPSDKMAEWILGEFKMAGVTSAKELVLEVGEDRLFLQSTRAAYELDLFLPVLLDPAQCCAQLNTDQEVLRVHLRVQ